MTPDRPISLPLPIPLVLGIDTCGPSGSVALGRLTGAEVEVLSQIELEGRTYSATLIAAVSEILGRHKVGLTDIGCLVVVNGPGSFTGVRVGLSAAKGLAEGAGIAVVAVSRLQVLAHKLGVANAALDAHRHEIFLRLGGKELLAGAGELAGLTAPAETAVCDPAAVALLEANWPGVKLLHVAAPTAADALLLAVPLIRSNQFADVALLDGHYLRRSDAEIFGEPAAVAAGTHEPSAHEQGASMSEITVRPMTAADLDAVIAIAASLDTAPHWPRPAYETAINLAAIPERIALVAEISGAVIGFAVVSLLPPQAELETIAIALAYQRCGAGRALMRALISELGPRKIAEISLEVRASNLAAQSFYAAQSFITIGRRKAYYADTGEDAALMRALLPLP